MTIKSNAIQSLITLRQHLQETFNTFETMQYENRHSLQLGDTLDALQSEINRIDYTPVIIVSFNTGTYKNKVIAMLGTSNDDIMCIIDEYAQETENNLTRYESGEVFSYHESYQDESFLPINGGEWYTDSIVSISEANIYDMLDN